MSYARMDSLLKAAKLLIAAAESEGWDRARGTDEPRTGVAELRAAIRNAESTREWTAMYGWTQPSTGRDYPNQKAHVMDSRESALEYARYHLIGSPHDYWNIRIMSRLPGGEWKLAMDRADIDADKKGGAAC